jgi:hypothetical protein
MSSTAIDQPTPRLQQESGDRHKPVAIFVCHGMGEQVHFETIEAVVDALLREEGIEDARAADPAPFLKRLMARPPRSNQTAQAQLVKLGDNSVMQGRVTLGQGENAREAHVYEGYWSPLTKGKIGVWQVFNFLFDTAALGIWNCVRNRKFIRFMFRKKEEFQAWHIIALGTLLLLTYFTSLLLVLPVFLTSVFTLSTLLSKLFSAGTAAWIVTPIVSAETWYVARIEAFLFGVGIATVLLPKLYSWLRRNILLLRILGWIIRAATFLLAIWSLIGLALTLLLAFIRFARYANQNLAGGTPNQSNLVQPLPLFFNPIPQLLHLWIHTLLTAFAHLARLPDGLFRFALIWTLALVFGYFIRWFLINFAGDVAIYTTSYKVSQFDEVRDKIRLTVLDAAQTVYSARVGNQPTAPFLYDHVFVVGHSLGSVIAYDTLNTLLCDDQLGMAQLDVQERTRLFLTFGSPLDKTAFIFRTHSSKTQDFREEAAEQLQPLIQSYTFRPDYWVNIWSPMDIISGILKYYDDLDKKAGGRKRVKNLWDKQAWVPFAAHTEYWNNSLFSKILRGAILALPLNPANTANDEGPGRAQIPEIRAIENHPARQQDGDK